MLENVRADLDRFLDQVARCDRSRGVGSGSGNLHRKTWRVARTILGQYALQALLVYRFGRWVSRVGNHGVGRTLAVAFAPAVALGEIYVRLAYDVHLDRSSEIGPGLFISHIGGIRIRGCRIGAGCSIHHRVCIEPRPGDSAGPVIGSAVWIGPHAAIRGPLTVGDGATIGTAAVVMKDVAPEHLVVGNPARVVWAIFDNRPLLHGPTEG